MRAKLKTKKMKATVKDLRPVTTTQEGLNLNKMGPSAIFHLPKEQLRQQEGDLLLLLQLFVLQVVQRPENPLKALLLLQLLTKELTTKVCKKEEEEQEALK